MAGTTGSSGLNNFLESSNQVQTTLPSWYDAAQQNVNSQAGSALSSAPNFGDTTAQGAVNTLQGNANPFTQAQGALNTIAQGAANPWITDASGNVNPNTNTALGGLFAAQSQQLNQLMPTTLAPSQAAGIGSGNFGSLRGQTAVDTAKTNAFDTLAAQQMAAALQNQQTGASAGSALGAVGGQGITADLSTGAAQMNAPYQNALNYANIVNSLNVPGTTTQQTQESPLQMISSLAGAPAAAGSLLGSLFGSSSTSGTLANALKNIPGLSSLFSGNTNGSGITVDANGNPVSGTYTLADGGQLTINPDGSQSIKATDGTVQNFDANGNPYTAATNSGNPPVDIGTGATPTDTTGGGYVDPNTGESVPS